MNIKSVDIDRLVSTLSSEQTLCSEDIELVDRILFGYDNVTNPTGDVVFVFGNPTCLDDRIVKGVDIVKSGAAKCILLSGGVLLPNNDLTEALGMEKYCYENGLVNSQVIVENQSTITYENVIFSAPYINELQIPNIKVIAVSSSTHMRRVMLNFEKYSNLYQSDITIIPCHSVHPSCDPKTWFMDSYARKVVATELSIIKDYIYTDGYPEFEF